jgi:hypothetical protein
MKTLFVAALAALKQKQIGRHHEETLLTVGFAVLVSMMLAPHGGKYGIAGWGPFFSAQGFHVTSGRDLVRGRWQGHDRHAGARNGVPPTIRNRQSH